MDDHGTDFAGGPDGASRARTIVILLLGAAAIAVATIQGVSLWPGLPDRIPTHFGWSGAPDAWADKTVWSVFGGLIMAGALLLVIGVAAVAPINPTLYNFPGKDRLLRLSRARQLALIQPIKEGLAWMAAAMSLALSNLARQTWEVALERRQAINPWALTLLMLAGGAGVVVGILYTRVLLRDLEEREGG